MAHESNRGRDPKHPTYEAPPTGPDAKPNGNVTISEMIRAVNSALLETLTDCIGADLNNDGTIDVAELVAIVNAALMGVAQVEAASGERTQTL